MRQRMGGGRFGPPSAIQPVCCAHFDGAAAEWSLRRDGASTASQSHVGAALANSQAVNRFLR
jgi:hypothetical protein